MDKIDQVLTRGVEKIYPSKQALEKVLRSGKKIRLYQGFDPSAPSLHLGHIVGVLKLRQFQELGHEVIFLVGDFTGMIGDPTDKTAARKQLTRKQVLANCRNWKDQASKILNFGGKNPARWLYNSQWLSRLSFAELLNLAPHLTYQQTIKREMFRKRLREDKDIYLHEFLYPLLQGYDSVHLEVDLEVGGSDQMFNMLIGRDLLHKIKGKEKFVLTTKLLVDAQGEKVGKTTGNALFLTASPTELFGGVMSFPDEVIALAFELLTLVPLPVPQSKNPMVGKKKLAWEIVKLYHGEKAADQAQAEFERTFQQQKTPTQMPVVKISTKKISLIELLLKARLVSSRGEAKRLIGQKAVEVDEKVTKDQQQEIAVRSGIVIRVGKRKFVKLEKV